MENVPPNVPLGQSCPDLLVTGIFSKEAFLKYLKELKIAAETKNSKKIAKYINFPLRVNTSPKPLFIKNKSQFNKKFNLIFTPGVLKAIQKTAPEDIFCRDQGAMMGNGEVWIREIKGKIGINSINP